jgi:hypothetical protein
MLRAHAYGIPETISVAVPLALGWLLLRSARRRDEARRAATAPSSDEGEST